MGKLDNWGKFACSTWILENLKCVVLPLEFADPRELSDVYMKLSPLGNFCVRNWKSHVTMQYGSGNVPFWTHASSSRLFYGIFGNRPNFDQEHIHTAGNFRVWDFTLRFVLINHLTIYFPKSGRYLSFFVSCQQCGAYKGLFLYVIYYFEDIPFGIATWYLSVFYPD